MKPGECRVVRRRLSIRHPDVIIINIKVGGVCGRGDLGYVGSSGLGDVVPVNSSEERMILEIQDPILSHPANNQSEISNVLCKPIRDQYCCVLTNQRTNEGDINQSELGIT